MRFQEIPGISQAWIDFLESKLPGMPGPATLQDLIERAGMLRSSGIDSPGVVAKIRPGLLGGANAQVLKCLTAIKLCEHLAAHSIKAVPVVLLEAWVPQDSKWSITLLNEDGDLRTFDFSCGGILTAEIETLISHVEDFGRGAFDREVLSLLRDCFASGQSMESATLKLVTALLRDWGLAAGTQPAEIPVLACVAGLSDMIPAEAESAWPQASATVADVRTRRTLERYGLEFVQLLQGPERVLATIASTLPKTALDRIAALEQDAQAHLEKLRLQVPADRSFLKTADSTREKISYQLNKLRDRLADALETKEQTANRRVRGACNLVAPCGRLQETELASIQIPLRYTPAGLKTLYEQLDVLTFEHQLIWMG